MITSGLLTDLQFLHLLPPSDSCSLLLFALSNVLLKPHVAPRGSSLFLRLEVGLQSLGWIILINILQGVMHHDFQVL